jgi:polysaccharide pyruvyl transferase WcaK-like protein
LNQWLFRTAVAKFFKKYIIFWGISIDIKDKENYIKVKDIFYGASEIYVRDEFSKKFLNYL